MATYFFDSSALVKCYVAEAGSDWVRGLWADPVQVRPFVAEVTRVEVVAAFLRRQPPPASSELVVALTQFDRDCRRRRFRFVAVNRALIAKAIEMAMRYRLRGYDSVQLASATVARSRCRTLRLSLPVFISADNDLNAAAASEGFAVEDPNAHA